MPVNNKRVSSNKTIAVATTGALSAMIDVSHAVAGCFVTPGTLTNTGATNVMRFGVSNNFGEPEATVITDQLPTTTIATAVSQQQAVSSFYPFPSDVFKFKYVRFDGHIDEAAERTYTYSLVETYTSWRRYDATIAASGTTSEAIPLLGAIGGSFLIPAAITSTAVTYSASLDGGTFVILATTADVDISQGVAVDRWIPFPDGVFAGTHVKFVFGSTEAAARQIRCDFKHIG